MSKSSDTAIFSATHDKDVTGTTRAAGVTAWRHIADVLAEQIHAGEIEAGGRLPIEAELASRFGVNRHTVRRALGELARRGLVRTAQGRGTFVEQRPLPYPIGSRTRFSEIVSRAGRDAAGALLGAEVVEADVRVAAGLGLEAGAAVLRLDTLRTADAAPIATCRAFFPLPRFAGLDDAFRQHGTLSAALESCGVNDYRRAETHVSARLATTDEAARLDLAPGRPVLTVESVNVDAKGQPIQVAFAVFAADRCELVIES